MTEYHLTVPEAHFVIAGGPVCDIKAFSLYPTETTVAVILIGPKQTKNGFMRRIVAGHLDCCENAADLTESMEEMARAFGEPYAVPLGEISGAVYTRSGKSSLVLGVSAAFCEEFGRECPWKIGNLVKCVGVNIETGTILAERDLQGLVQTKWNESAQGEIVKHRDGKRNYPGPEAKTRFFNMTDVVRQLDSFKTTSGDDYRMPTVSCVDLRHANWKKAYGVDFPSNT